MLPSPPGLRVLIADDHRVWTEGLALSLERHGLQTVGIIHSGAQVMDACLEQHPDIVLLDIRLPDRDGIDVLMDIRDRLPQTTVLILTASSDPTLPRRALELGAAGFISKSASSEELARAIRHASGSHSPEAPDVPPTPPSLERASTVDLTPTELRILKLLAQGLDNHTIGRQLTISENTVKTHVSNLLGKLQLPNRTLAAAWAIEHGFAS